MCQALPDAATDAVLALWRAARPVIEGAAAVGDEEADIAQQAG